VKTTGMNFIEAVKAAKNGHRVTRASWDNAYIFVENDRFCFGCGGECVLRNVLSHIDHYLAEDWEIVLESLETMTFQEAVDEMEQGKKIQRLVWSKDIFLSIDKGDEKATDWIVCD